MSRRTQQFRARTRREGKTIDRKQGDKGSPNPVNNLTELTVANLQKRGESKSTTKDNNLPMEDTPRTNTEEEVRTRLTASIDKAKEMCTRLQEQTLVASKATDKVVRENPYQAVGIAFGVGLLIGLLAARRGSD